MKQFWLDGRSSREFGMMITGAGTYNAPERDVEFISIEGRNGDLIIDNGRFKNVPLSYPISICMDFPEKAAAARAWLLSKSGYMRLEDDYDPEHFRLAAFTGPLDFDVKFLNRAAEATLQFNCKPQRFLKSGEIPIEVTDGQLIFNPTPFPALPIIRVYGEGEATIYGGSTKIKILNIGGGIEIDCEAQFARDIPVPGKPGWYRDSDIYVEAFPVLGPAPDYSTFLWTSNVTKVEIIPRWWTV